MSFTPKAKKHIGKGVFYTYSKIYPAERVYTGVSFTYSKIQEIFSYLKGIDGTYASSKTLQTTVMNKILALLFLISTVSSFDFECGELEASNTTELPDNYLQNLVTELPKKFDADIATIKEGDTINVPLAYECILDVLPSDFKVNQSDAQVRLLLLAYNNLQTKVLNYILNNTTRIVAQKEEGLIENTLKNLHIEHPKLYNLAVITNIVITFVLLLTLSITVLCKYTRQTRTTGQGPDTIPLNPTAPFYQPSERRVGQNIVRRLR